MNETSAHAAMVLGPEATRQLALSARPDAPVLPENPRREARRRRRRERAGGRLRQPGGERRHARSAELAERHAAAGEREDQRIGRSAYLRAVATGPVEVGGDKA